MKINLNRLNTLLFSLFVIGILAVAYNLFNLQGALERGSIKIDAQVLEDIEPVLLKNYLIIGFTLLTGIGTLFITIFMNNENAVKERIVYRDRVEMDPSSSSVAHDEQQEDEGLKVQQIGALIAGEKDLKIKIDKWLTGVCNKIEASQAVFYIVTRQQKKKIIEMYTAYAFNATESERIAYEMGEGLVGQVAKSGKKLYIDDVPENYIKIISGLGSGSPKHLLLLPFMDGKDVLAVVEIASFKEIRENHGILIDKAYKLLSKDLLNFLKESESVKKKQNKESNSNKLK